MGTSNPLVYLFGKTWHYSAGNRKNLFAAWSMLIISKSLELFLQPLIWAWIINIIQVQGITNANINKLIWFLVATLGLEPVIWTFHGPARLKEQINAFKVRLNYRKHLLKGVMTLPMEWHVDHHSGDTIDKIEKGTSSLHSFSEDSFEPIYSIVELMARNAYDGGWVITALDEGKLLEVKTAHRTYYNTPEDKFMLQLEFGMAKKSSDDNSVAVKRGLRSKVQMGWYPSRAPLGYLNTISNDKGMSEVIKDPERFDTVRRMWDLMLTGNITPPQILKIVSNEWKFKTRTTKRQPGNSLSRSGIYRVFTNPFYYGWFEYGRPRQLSKGSHEPMITEEEFDRVQRILGREGKPRPQEHRFAFTGLMRCGNCGAMITAEEKIKRQIGGTYWPDR